MSNVYCRMCNDTLAHPDDPTGQADCGYCGGSYAWRQREAWAASQDQLVRFDSPAGEFDLGGQG